MSETRPAKKVRLEAPLQVTSDTRDEMEGDDDWDDIYENNSPAATATANTSSSTTTDAVPAATAPVNTSDLNQVPLSHPNAQPPPPHLAAGPVCDSDDAAKSPEKNELPAGMPAEAISTGDDLVPAVSQPMLEPQEERVFAETTTVERGAPVSESQQNGGSVEGEASNSTDVPMLDTGGMIERPTKAVEDPEFLAAAAAQKGEKTAEWQYDTSDAESSSDSDTSSDSSDSDSDSGSDDGYELLDPATAAKILMSGDADDDEGGKSKGSGANNAPRTANEVKEEVVSKPDVTVTPETKITFLGSVEQAVENMILIKGATTGEYHVLESGSVLCNEAREVIGAVADTFGRVQQPLYSVAFTNASEVEAANLTHGVKVFYVDEHSTFVFTQPLKNLKGTDASNIHDEEVREDEQEFSDDEKEAEYKRQKKQAKKAGREGPSRSAFNESRNASSGRGYDEESNFVNGSDAPASGYGGGMEYDDEPGEQFYAPLKRPDNLSELMSGGIPLPPKPQFDRGRGRGRGDRGRGDRGRGRGDRGRGRGAAQRGGDRGGFRNRDNQRSNTESSPSAPYAQAHAQYQTTPQYQQQAPQTYQFNGYQFQYGNQPQPAAAPQYQYYQQQQPQAQQGASIPPGSYVNPNSNFYQQQTQPPHAQYPAWNPNQQQYAQSYGVPQQQYQQQYQPQQQVPDINAILHNLGHPQPPR